VQDAIHDTKKPYAVGIGLIGSWKRDGGGISLSSGHRQAASARRHTESPEIPRDYGSRPVG